MIRVFFGVPESYGNTYWALLGHTGKKEKGLKGGRTPPLGLVRIGLGNGGRTPPLPSFSFSLPLFLFHMGGGILLGGGKEGGEGEGRRRRKRRKGGPAP